jgi:hypothetical protein
MARRKVYRIGGINGNHLRLQYYKKNRSLWKLPEDERRAKILINKDLADKKKTPTTQREEYGRSHPMKKVGRQRNVVTSPKSKEIRRRHPSEKEVTKC